MTKTTDKMEIVFDQKADAMFIRLRKGKFSRNKKVDDFTIIDYDKGDNILGIELLSVSQRFPAESLQEVNVKNLLPRIS